MNIKPGGDIGLQPASKIFNIEREVKQNESKTVAGRWTSDEHLQFIHGKCQMRHHS